MVNKYPFFIISSETLEVLIPQEKESRHRILKGLLIDRSGGFVAPEDVLGSYTYPNGERGYEASYRVLEVGMPEEKIMALAKQFGQVSFLYVDSENLVWDVRTDGLGRTYKGRFTRISQAESLKLDHTAIDGEYFAAVL